MIKWRKVDKEFIALFKDYINNQLKLVDKANKFDVGLYEKKVKNKFKYDYTFSAFFVEKESLKKLTLNDAKQEAIELSIQKCKKLMNEIAEFISDLKELQTKSKSNAK